LVYRIWLALVAFSVMMLLVGCHEGHLACEKSRTGSLQRFLLEDLWETRCHFCQSVIQLKVPQPNDASTCHVEEPASLRCQMYVLFGHS